MTVIITQQNKTPQTSISSCVNCIDCITQKYFIRNTRQEVDNYTTEERSCSQHWDGWGQSHEYWGSDLSTHITTWGCYIGPWPHFCILYFLASVYTFLHVHMHRHTHAGIATHIVKKVFETSSKTPAQMLVPDIAD